MVRSTSNPFFDPIVAVLGAPPKGGFSPDQWGDPDIATDHLADDFTDVQHEGGSFTWKFDSLDAARHFLLHESPMHVDVFGRVDGDRRDRLEAAFMDALRRHVHADGGVRFDSPFVLITASRR